MLLIFSGTKLSQLTECMQYFYPTALWKLLKFGFNKNLIANNCKDSVTFPRTLDAAKKNKINLNWQFSVAVKIWTRFSSLYRPNEHKRNIYYFISASTSKFVLILPSVNWYMPTTLKISMQ